MYDELDGKLESRILAKLASGHTKTGLKDGFKGNKVVNEVMDKSTVMTLFKMIGSHTISHVNGAVKAGKESVVFWGVDENNHNVALKVYLVSTSNFKNRLPYLQGDPRFSRIKKGTRNLVYLWAKKEFRNLSQCYDGSIPVPKPIQVSNNVLAMEFVGTGGAPANTLLESSVDENDYNQTIEILKKIYRDVRLVHADFSEYNIFKTDSGLVVFDLGSAVDLRHPRSKEFLKRDINNITRFFVKRGLVVENPVDVYRYVVS